MMCRAARATIEFDAAAAVNVKSLELTSPPAFVALINIPDDLNANVP